MDTLAGQVAVSPGDEVARPKHLMDREYPVCVDALNPHGGSVTLMYEEGTELILVPTMDGAVAEWLEAQRV